MALAGAYSIDITPEEQVDLNGYILRFGKSEGIHDRLTANILYIESSNKKMLLLSLDILTISTEIAKKLKDQLSRLLKIEKEAVILAAIHTHSAVGSPYLRNVGKESELWREDFEKKILEGCTYAQKAAKECEIFSYEAHSSVGINRRNPSRGIDPNAPFIVIKNGDKIIAWIINYNCHAVSLTEKNLLISADYVHYLRLALYEKLQQQFPVLFFNGGSGDVDPVKRGSFEDAKYIGEKLAQELFLVYQAYKGEMVSDEIKCKALDLCIPYSWQPGIEEAKENLKVYLKRFDNSITKEEKKISGAFKKWAEDILEKVERSDLPEALNIKISFISLGDILFIAVPIEIFSSISLKLRRIFGRYKVFVVSYANGYSGYLADKAAHFEGGYEIEDWHKYAGILPQDKNAEEYFWKVISTFEK
ncbi:MAG: neutral/alkaline non-lysosomal ceramidase N-terminal domain-containing protein [Bacteroidota bacterium]|nr:neutral/alkaline non-lysosomal ceramidase N-terminal domain-containing protein [Bacteroidota bacterium]